MTESSQKCPTPRLRFVAAMREIVRCHTYTRKQQREAAEAFADAECRWPEHTQDLGKFTEHDAAACRAALLKEIGL